MNKIYIGNLPYKTSENELEGIFGQFGKIVETKVITDRVTGQSKGFAFIQFDDEESAKKATTIDGQDMNGRPMKVSIARAQKPKERTGGGRQGGKVGSQQW